MTTPGTPPHDARTTLNSLSLFLQWSFGFCESGSGVYPCHPRQNPAYTYKESVKLGETTLTKRQVEQLIHELQISWPGNSYHVLDRNCNHFCHEFALRLGLPKGIPGWINRLARGSSATLRFVHGVKLGVRGMFRDFKEWTATKPATPDPSERGHGRNGPSYDPSAPAGRGDEEALVQRVGNRLGGRPSNLEDHNHHGHHVDPRDHRYQATNGNSNSNHRARDKIYMVAPTSAPHQEYIHRS